MMGMTMRIGLLGALQISDGEGHQVPVGGRRARMLVVMLALEAGHVVPVSSRLSHWPATARWPWPPATPSKAAALLDDAFTASMRGHDMTYAIQAEARVDDGPVGLRTKRCRSGAGPGLGGPVSRAGGGPARRYC
jgi:hypothetical protein